ncbi:MAG: alpha/beta hydrolase [Spirochaetes bacterium]|nr:alpha/beta hydrolase [Spirochaetota bacterium]
MPLWEKNTPGLDPAIADKPYIDPYILDNGKKTGVVVVLPGGGYVNKAAHEAEPIARMLNDAGISAVVCNYRVSPYRHPYPLMDAKRAMRLVRANAAAWNIDPDHVGVLGFSAGGHLASTIATHWNYNEEPSTADAVDAFSCRPDAAVLCYAVIALSEPFGHTGSMKNLLGENPSDDLIRFLSNEKQVNEKTPPTFLWHTADDAVVNVKNAYAFAAALRDNNVPCEMHIYPHGRHGLGVSRDIPEVTGWAGLCTAWLKRLGF